MKRVAQSGFAILEMLLIIVAIGIIAFVAWRIVDANGTVEQAANSVSKSTVATDSSTPAVNPASTNDLTTLEKQIDGTTIDDNSTAQLDTQSTF